jgi:pimeloyl-ACP methyl ester carboxylesterase
MPLSRPEIGHSVAGEMGQADGLRKLYGISIAAAAAVALAASAAASGAAELRGTVTAVPPVVLFDGNPQFVGTDLARAMRDPLPARVATPADAFSTSGYVLPTADNIEHLRDGVVADGVSLLLVRAYVPGPGGVGCRVVDRNGVADPDANGRCDILYPAEPVHEVRYRFGRWETMHAVFARYTPPEAFGTASPDDEAEFGSKAVRRLEIEISWTDAQSPTTPEYRMKKGFVLERPPVVLVHGTYDNPTDCWDYPRTDIHWRAAPAIYQQQGLAGKLRDLGYRVYLVDFERSNGFSGTTRETGTWVTRETGTVGYWSGRRPAPPMRPHQRSHFRDNQKVVMVGGTRKGDGRGIAAALEEYRARKIAVTQADVVGHSMGGVLIRAYARGAPLPINPGEVCLPPATPETPEGPGNWYYRDDNFHQGDINRIITIGSTHKGSHMSQLLQHYSFWGQFDVGSDGRELGPDGALRASEIRRATPWTASASRSGPWRTGVSVSSTVAPSPTRFRRARRCNASVRRRCRHTRSPGSRRSPTSTCSRAWRARTGSIAAACKSSGA